MYIPIPGAPQEGGSWVARGGLFGGGGSKTKVESAKLSSEEKRLIETQDLMAQTALEVLKGARGSIEALTDLYDAGDYAGAMKSFQTLKTQAAYDVSKFRAAERNLAGTLQKTAKHMMNQGQNKGAQRMLATLSSRVMNMGEPELTRRQNELINNLAATQVEMGESDISAYRDESLREIANVLGPQRGLRPGDTPLIDRGQLVAQEALRQQGQLVRGVRAQALQSKLEYPLQVRAQELQQKGIAAGVLGQRADLSMAQTQLGMAGLGQMAGMAQQAMANRAKFASVLAGGQLDVEKLRLGMATGIQPQVGSALSAIAASKGQTQTTSMGPLQGISSIAGGVGGLMTGLSAAGIISDRALKQDIDELPEWVWNKYLYAIRNLPVATWKYNHAAMIAKGFMGDGNKHIGPMAQDFAELTGFGDGNNIPLVDAIGVLIAAIKALDLKVKRLEKQNA